MELGVSAPGPPAATPAVAVAVTTVIATVITVIATVATAIAAVIAAAVIDLDKMAGPGCRRGGDHCRLSRRGVGRGNRCGGNSYRGSPRRQQRCDELQSVSHGDTLSGWLISPPVFDGTICARFPELRSTQPMSSPLTPSTGPR